MGGGVKEKEKEREGQEERQKQGHKKRGPVGRSLLRGTPEGQPRPPEGAPSRRGGGEERGEERKEERRGEATPKHPLCASHAQHCSINQWELSQGFIGLFAISSVHRKKTKTIGM